MRITILALICSLLIGSMTGCKQESVEDTAFVVTDQAGREVRIEKEPETIVSSYYIATSMLIALDQESKIVGVENKAAERTITKLSAPEVADAACVGTAKDFDLEMCAALNPDLVVLPLKLKDVIPSLQQLGITAVVINPETQELLEEAILLLGEVTGSKAIAEELVTFTAEKIKKLNVSMKNVAKKRVYLAGTSGLLSTAGARMYQNSMILQAGGENVAEALQDNYWMEIDYEQLLAWDPEYIIIAAEANYSTEDVLSDKRLTECTAVKNGDVYQIPNDIEALDSPVPGSLLGNLWLASVLHPDVYTEVEYERAVVEFYETFYQFTP